MKRIVVIILIIALVAGVGLFLYKKGRSIYEGIKPVVTKPPIDISNELRKQEGSPLLLPEGFSLSIFAEQIPGARVMTFAPNGDLWVSQRKEGVVSMVLADGRVSTPLRNLNNPHGIVFDPRPNEQTRLWIAEEHQIRSIPLYSEAPFEHVVDLPSGGRHVTRTLLFTDQNELLVSIGSTCDTCEEKNPQAGSIQLVDISSKTLVPYARGLRNAVFMATDPLTGNIWSTEMGRDGLGDDLPPDEINIIKKDYFYGWPWFYGQNIRDEKFQPNVAVSLAYPLQSAHINLPAHVAPLGLAFVPTNSNWPKEYHNDLLVAYHGSWNRSDPVGYSIARFDRDEQGVVVEEYDFITGWLTDDNKALGRPVDLKFYNGDLYISDDHAGVIYTVTYQNNNTAQ